MESWQESIICPNCNHALDNDEMYDCETDVYAICPNEDNAKVKCQACGETFFVEGSYQPKYRSFKTEEEMEDVS